MTTFQAVVECLRPLVNTGKCDYFVVWKLGENPSRFIQWQSCCCSGGFTKNSINLTEESDKKEQHLLSLCKDSFNKHLVSTNSCKALAQFPSSIALYSGVHGEAVISKQSKWITHVNNSSSEHKTGTQVLIPFSGSLIELFISKHVPRDQKIIDFISAQCSIHLEKETMTSQTFTEFNFRDWPASHHDFDAISGIRYLPPVNQARALPSFEGSSTSSNFSNENKRLDSLQVSREVTPENSKGKYFGKEITNKHLIVQQETDFASKLTYQNSSREYKKANQKTENGKYHSKNLVTERKRRKRIKDGLLALRALVPKITKMDKLSILGDACDYIQELEQCKKKNQDELREMMEEDSSKNNTGSAISKPDQKLGLESHSHVRTSVRKQAEVEIEVSPIGTTYFLLRITCKKRQGGFLRLMEAAKFLGLQVIDVNVTTLDGMVLNILKVNASTKDIQAKSLKDSLTELIAQMPEEVGLTRKR